jgi:hypothetical protein
MIPSVPNTTNEVGAKEGRCPMGILEKFIELLSSASSLLDRVLNLWDRIAGALAAVKAVQAKAQAIA